MLPKIVLPRAKVIVNKFHIGRMANVALDSFRKELREDLTHSQRRTLMHDRFTLLKRRSELNTSEILKLQSWTLNFPTLGTAYNLKESFFDI
jgi:transposase